MLLDFTYGTCDGGVLLFPDYPYPSVPRTDLNDTVPLTGNAAGEGVLYGDPDCC